MVKAAKYLQTDFEIPWEDNNFSKLIMSESSACKNWWIIIISMGTKSKQVVASKSISEKSWLVSKILQFLNEVYVC